MKNPLNKRYLRELKGDFGKYIVIFLLMIITIGFVSGFEVADNSMIKTYNESFKKYNIEDGHFVSERKLTSNQRRLIENNDITLYDDLYIDQSFLNGTTIRIFNQRDYINLADLMSGEYPSKNDEIAIDRMYADNNDLSIGDTLESEDGTSYKITGLIALSDYSTMFQNNSDLMFDAVQFSIALVTNEQFNTFDEALLTYNYAWKYNDTSIVGSDDEEDVSKDLMSAVSDVVELEEFIPRYQNQAITFTGEDMGSDGAMMVVFLDITVFIIAFVFAITTRDTIQKESLVIGTLRASGFTVSELVRHYMVMPILVTLISAIVGNILGYTVLKDVCANMYYGSYSLPTYTTYFNADAFLQTTVVPCIIMAITTWIVLRRSLSLSPLKFLRHDLSRKKNKKAFFLSHKIPFFSRYRTRILFQNIPNYLILFFGILFGNIMLLFGLALPQILEGYQESIGENMLAKYQTILSVPSNATDENHRFESMVNLLTFSKSVETSNKDAEKFSAYELKTLGSEEIKSDEIMLYGIEDNSKYVKLPGEGVYISYLYADKYDLGEGDSITLYEEYDETKSYTFTIDGVMDYEGSVSIFMPKEKLNRIFDLSDDFFAGYFSNEKITDIDSKYIGSVIDYDTLTKVSRQLMVSMGDMMYMVDGFCVGMFVILMYLLSKIIIEKNTQSISMTKILGYNNQEISKLYIRAMTIATLLCILISIPICSVALIEIYRIMLKAMMTGWIIPKIETKIYLYVFILGALSYAIVALIEMHKIKKIPMDQALKNVE